MSHGKHILYLVLPNRLELLLNQFESWSHTFLLQVNESAIFLNRYRDLFDGVLHVRLEFGQRVRLYVLDTPSVIRFKGMHLRFQVEFKLTEPVGDVTEIAVHAFW